MKYVYRYALYIYMHGIKYLTNNSLTNRLLFASGICINQSTLKMSPTTRCISLLGAQPSVPSHIVWNQSWSQTSQLVR